MAEITERFDEVKKRIKYKGEVVPCKKCGSTNPFIKSVYGDLERETWVQCDCGVRIYPSVNRRGGMIDRWNKTMQEGDYTPASQPHYIGKSRQCQTCLLKGNCVEAKKLSCLTDFVCGDWVEEVE